MAADTSASPRVGAASTPITHPGRGRQTRRKVTVAAVAAMASVASAATAAPFTWVKSTSGTFGAGTNWDVGTPPPTADTSTVLNFAATGTYTATNDLGPLVLNQLNVNASAGTVTLAGNDLDLTFDSNLGKAQISDQSTTPLTINNNVAFNNPTDVFVKAGSTVTIAGATTLTPGSQFVLRDDVANPDLSPGGMLTLTQPMTIAGGYFPFRIKQGTIVVAGGLSVDYANGGQTDFFVGNDDQPTDTVAMYLSTPGATFNTRVKIGNAGGVTVGGLNTTGTVTFQDFFNTINQNGAGQTINYFAAAGGTVQQNNTIIGGSLAGIAKAGGGTWVVSGGGVNSNPGDGLAYSGNTTVRDGTLALNYDDTGTGGNGYGGSLGFNANAVQLGDAGTLPNDNLALLTLGTTRLLVHNLSVNANNPTGTTTVGVGDNGAGTFTGTMALNGNVTLTGGTGGTATFSGVISGTGKLTAAGAGTVVLAAAETYTGTTNVSAGTLTLAPGATLASQTVVVAAGGTLALAPTTGTRTLLAPTSLTLSGKLDVGNNDVDFKNPSANAGVISLSSLTAAAATGYAGGTFNGASGITSAVAAANVARNTAVAVVSNNVGGTALVGAGKFAGTTPGLNDILIAYTYYGDANLDGRVNGADYARIDAGYAAAKTTSPLTGWYSGDFNYDGKVDGSDYTLIDNAFNTQGAALVPGAISAAPAAELTAVPEPAVTGLVVVAAGLLIRGRRRA